MCATASGVLEHLAPWSQIGRVQHTSPSTFDARPIVDAIQHLAAATMASGEKEHVLGLTYEGWLALLTFFLTLATIALGIFTYLLWRSTAKALADAQEGVAISREALALSRLSSEQQLRAYVEVKTASMSRERLVDPEGAPQLWLQGKVRVENTGQTPARSLRVWSRFEFTPERPEFKTEQTREHGSVIGPGHGQTLMAADTLENIAEGDTIWLLGQVKYVDVFGHDHETGFCLKALTEDQFAPDGPGNYST